MVGGKLDTETVGFLDSLSYPEPSLVDTYPIISDVGLDRLRNTCTTDVRIYARFR